MYRLLTFITLLLSFFLPVYGFYACCQMSFPHDSILDIGSENYINVTFRLYILIASTSILLLFYFIFLLKLNKQVSLIGYNIVSIVVFIVFYLFACFFIVEGHSNIYSCSWGWKKIFFELVLYQKYTYFLGLLGILINICFHQALEARKKEQSNFDDLIDNQ